MWFILSKQIPLEYCGSNLVQLQIVLFLNFRYFSCKHYSEEFQLQLPRDELIIFDSEVAGTAIYSNMDSSPSKSSILIRVDYVASDTSDREDENVKMPTENTTSATLEPGKISKSKKRKLPSTPDIDKPSLQITEPPKKRRAKILASPVEDETNDHEDEPQGAAPSKVPIKGGPKSKNLLPQPENATPKQRINHVSEAANSMDTSQQEENSSVMAESPQVPKKRGRPKKSNLDAIPNQVDEQLNQSYNEISDSRVDTAHLERNSSLIDESLKVPKKRGRKPKNVYPDEASSSSVSQQQPAEKTQPPTELILEMNGNAVMEGICDDLTPNTPTMNNGPKKRGRKPKTPGTQVEVSTPPATPVSVRKSSRTPRTPVEYAEHENTPTTSKRTKKTAALVDPLSLSDDEAKTDRRVVKPKKVSNNVSCLSVVV